MSEHDISEPAVDPDAAGGVAIIGLAGRYPGAPSIGQFWDNLRNGVESVRFFTDEELIAAGVDAALLARPEYVRAKGYLDGVDLFDASFFGYTPREATVMDPQQRLFLETAWEALEDAGYSPQRPGTSIGVFAACSINTYLLGNWTSDAFRALDGMELSVSSDKDFLATRVSYKLNLKGPSVVVQTACSSSLAAVCQAAQTLLSYQCDVALAGGVSVNNPRISGYLHKQGAILSPDGHCRAFDAAAAGTVSGEGVGIVVLKRLAEAITDGDTIHAVIKGFALNNDGSNKVGYTAPSVDGQAEVIAMAQAFAGVDADAISYVETHGTGTDLGDPIEIAALTQAFRGSTARSRYCGIGSVKTNFGHTDAAAGVTGLIKTTLALEHGEIPPSLHFERPNPHIDFEHSPFYVVDRLTAWPAGSVPRRAGVSAFGLGGTNAHAVLAEAPAAPPSGPSRPTQLLLVSARTEAALGAAIERLRAHLQTQPQQALADVAFTLQVGRRDFDWRACVLCADAGQAVSRLARAGLGQRMVARERPLVFAFTGQGAQYPGMGAGLYRGEPVFRQVVDECCALLQERAGLDLKAVLYPALRDTTSEDAAVAAAAALRDTRVAQPALFVTEYALARLCMHWGLLPAAMIGHSIGEYVAACLAGVMSLADALELVALRGRMVGALSAGSMLAVALPERQLRPLLGPALSLAAVNAPSLCVVSGQTLAIDALEAELRGSGLEPVRLHTSHAFHSAMLDPMLDEFARRVAGVKLSAPTRRYISNLTGGWIEPAQAIDPRYWVRHLRETVQFSAGVKTLLDDDSRVFLEIGPGATLTGLIRQQLGAAAHGRVFSAMRAARDGGDDDAALLETLGRLWQTGSSVDWRAFSAAEQRRRVPLPTYPFERQRYWVEPGRAVVTPALEPALVKQPDLADWCYVPSWRQSAGASGVGAVAASGRWLVFDDATGLGERLVETLLREGAAVTVVRAGRESARLAADRFVVDPAVDEHFDRLFATLAAEAGLPERIVHLWAVTAVDADATPAGRQALLDRCFWSPTCIARSLGRLATRRIDLMFVSNAAQAVLPGDPVCPEKATLAGPCLVAPQEYPQLACRSVDLVWPAASDDSAALLIEQLVAEAATEASREPVAYRGRQRWLRGHEPVRLAVQSGRPTRLREHGVVLITGGLGGIGLAIAEELTRTVPAPRLVLVGRGALPEPAAWDAWLASHDERDRTGLRIRAVRRLEALGAEVLVARADVADRAQMQRVLSDTRARFGAVHGVVHAAGLPAGGIIELKTRAAADAILAPKVSGTRVLDEMLAGEPLDFFVLCSSLTATLGSAGQVDYTAANAFEDAYAQARRDGGKRLTVSIEWDSWGETGMAVDADLPAALAPLRQQALHAGLTNAEGVEVFRRALRCGLPQLLVSTRDLTRRLAPLAAGAPAQPSAAANATAPTAAASGAAPSGSERRALSTPYVAPRTETERVVAVAWQDLFGIASMGVDDNFFEADGHSLLAIQIVARLAQDLGVKLPVNALFESPTIAQIAQRIDAARSPAGAHDDKLAEALALVEQLSDEEVRRLLAEGGGER